VKTDLNTLLTTLYVHLDDRILPALGFSRDHHPGRKPALSDVELLCLIVAQHLLGIASERKWIRYAHTHLRGMFPNLPQQSGWSKRVRQATGLLSAVITELARDTPSWGEITRLIDSTPLPCGKSRETVKRSDLAGHAGYGYCASHSRYFWGFRLYLVCTPDGSNCKYIPFLVHNVGLLWHRPQYIQSGINRWAVDPFAHVAPVTCAQAAMRVS